LQTEYGAESRLEQSSWKVIRWVTNPDSVNEDILPSGARLANDAAGNTVILFTDTWSCDYFTGKNLSIEMTNTPPKSPIQPAEK
jgi:peptide subunit release factor RF-3